MKNLTKFLVPDYLPPLYMSLKTVPRWLLSKVPARLKYLSVALMVLAVAILSGPIGRVAEQSWLVYRNTYMIRSAKAEFQKASARHAKKLAELREIEKVVQAKEGEVEKETVALTCARCHAWVAHYRLCHMSIEKECELTRQSGAGIEDETGIDLYQSCYGNMPGSLPCIPTDDYPGDNEFTRPNQGDQP